MLYYKYKKEREGYFPSLAQSNNPKGGITKMYINLKPTDEKEQDKEFYSSLYESFKDTSGIEFRYFPDLPLDYIQQLYDEMRDRLSPIPIEFPVKNGVLYMKDSTMPTTNDRYIGAGYKTEYLTFPCIAPVEMPLSFFNFLQTVFQCGIDHNFIYIEEEANKLNIMDLID